VVSQFIARFYSLADSLRRKRQRSGDPGRACITENNGSYCFFSIAIARRSSVRYERYEPLWLEPKADAAVRQAIRQQFPGRFSDDEIGLLIHCAMFIMK
jgi:hypothetical protein